MGGQQPPTGGTDGGREPSARAAQRAERRAVRQRRQEERRRRWERSEGRTTTAAPDAAPAETTAQKPVQATGKATTETTTETVTVTGPASPDDGDAAGRGGVLTSDEPRPEVEPVRRPGSAAASGPVVLWHLVLAAHPRQALVTAAAFAGLAALTARPLEEVGVLAAMVLVGQTMLGWHNDLVDRDRDAALLAAARERGETSRLRRKPLAEGRLDPGTVWYAFALALLLLVPLSFASGVEAGAAYVVAVAIGLLGNVFGRSGWLSWLPWAASYALFPVVLAYAEPPGILPEGGTVVPQPSLVALSALLGVVVHVLRGLPGLVEDHRDGQRHLPLRLGLRLGAPRVLGVASVLAVALLVAVLTVGAQLGLVR